MVLGLTNESYERIMREYRGRLSSLGLSTEKFEDYTFEIDFSILKYGRGEYGTPRHPVIYVGRADRKEVVLNYRHTLKYSMSDMVTALKEADIPLAIREVLRFRKLLKANKIPFREAHAKKLEELLRGETGGQ